MNKCFGHFVAILVLTATWDTDSNAGTVDDGIWYSFCDSSIKIDQKSSKAFEYQGVWYFGDTDTSYTGCGLVSKPEQELTAPGWSRLLHTTIAGDALYALVQFEGRPNWCEVQRLNDVRWESVTPQFEPVALGMGPRCVEVWDSTIVIGASPFSGLPSLRSLGIGGWEYLGGFMPVIGTLSEGTSVEAMARTERGLIVAGRFEKLSESIWPNDFAPDTQSSIRSQSIAMWDGEKWHGMGKGVNGVIYSMATDNTNIFVGGNFDRAGDIKCSNIARWDGVTWNCVGSNGPDGIVHALCLFEGNLFITGDFKYIDGTVVNGIARFVNGEWKSLGSGLALSTGFPAYGQWFSTWGGTLALFGRFDRVDGREVGLAGSAFNWALWRTGGDDRVLATRLGDEVAVSVSPDRCPYSIELSRSLSGAWEKVEQSCTNADSTVRLRLDGDSAFVRVRRK